MSAPTPEPVSNRPCMLVADSNPLFAAVLDRSFRRLGWDVYQARTGPEARRLVRLLEAEMLVMSAELEGESGWLTCEKLKRESPQLKVYLLGDPRDRRQTGFARFVGAVGLIDRATPAAALVAEVCGRRLPVAG